MAIPDLVNLVGLMDDAKCFAFVCQRRWPEGILRPACDNDAVVRDGHDCKSAVDHDADQRRNTLDVGCSHFPCVRYLRCLTIVVLLSRYLLVQREIVFTQHAMA